MTVLQHIRPADVFIASHGRSGSTMLCALLTTAPKRIVINEPGIGPGIYGEHVRRQLEDAGLPIAAPPEGHQPLEHTGPDGDPAERAEALLSPAIAGCERWGVKEVNPDWIKAAPAVIRPRRTIVLVRDLDEAAASLYLKNKREGGRRSLRWLHDRMVASLHALSLILEGNTHDHIRRVWYHELVSSQQARQDLGDWLDWPLDGDPTTGFAINNRAHESNQHHQTISTNSIGSYRPGSDPELDRFVSGVLEMTTDLRAITHANRPE